MSIVICTVSQCCEGIQIIIAKACKLQKRPGNHTGQLVTPNLDNPLLILHVLSTQYTFFFFTKMYVEFKVKLVSVDSQCLGSV